jgi:anti-sigma B factor antagonist
MKFKVRDERGVSVVAGAGELDATSGPDLEATLDRLIADGHRSVVISAKEIGFIDSAGLAALVKALKRVRSAGGKLFLASLQPSVRRIFALTRLDKAFELCADDAEAIRKLSA